MSTKEIFLSYAQVNKAKAGQLREDLQDEGYLVWWDQDILTGKGWRREIRKALKNSGAFILCMSKEAEVKTRSGIYPEARNAIDIYRKHKPGEIFIMPVRFSECRIPDLEIDSGTMLEDLQHVDLFPDEARADGIERLLAALNGIPHLRDLLQKRLADLCRRKEANLTQKELEILRKDACRKAKKLVRNEEVREKIREAAERLIKENEDRPLSTQKMKDLDKLILSTGRKSDAKFVRWVLRCHKLHPQVR